MIFLRKNFTYYKKNDKMIAESISKKKNSYDKLCGKGE